MKRTTVCNETQLSLPRELWLLIFSELDSLEIANLQLVSKWAYQLFWNCISYLKFRESTTGKFLNLVLEKCNPYTIQIIVAITNSLNDNSLRCISRLINLKTLLLHNCAITDEGMSHLTSLKNLSYVDIAGGSKISSDCLKWFENSQSLRQVHINGLEVKGPVLSHLKNLKHLSHLGIDTCIDTNRVAETTIDDSELVYLADMVDLKKLSLFSCSQSGVTDGFSTITNLTNLRFLGLAHQNLTNNHCDALSKLTGLKKLALISAGLRDDGIIQLTAHLHQLTAFNLCGTMTDAGIESLQKLKLKSIDITSLYITNTSLLHISQIPTLKKLFIRMSPQITDEGLKYLKALPELSELRLHCLEAITNEGIIDLVQQKQLHELHIIKCSNITSDIRRIAHSDLILKFSQ